jgi:hypothetical protein
VFDVSESGIIVKVGFAQTRRACGAAGWFRVSFRWSRITITSFPIGTSKKTRRRFFASDARA